MLIKQISANTKRFCFSLICLFFFTRYFKLNKFNLDAKIQKISEKPLFFPKKIHTFAITYCH